MSSAVVVAAIVAAAVVRAYWAGGRCALAVRVVAGCSLRGDDGCCRCGSRVQWRGLAGMGGAGSPQLCHFTLQQLLLLTEFERLLFELGFALRDTEP